MMRNRFGKSALLLVLLAVAPASLAQPSIASAAVVTSAAIAAVAKSVDSTSGRPPGMAISFSAVLQVEEAEKTTAILVDRAEKLGGWFLRRSKGSVELRIPSALADSFIQGLDTMGVLVDRNYSTQNLEGEREELVSRLKARKAVLQDYYAMLKESSDSTLFTIQNEIVNLQSEIEQTTGQILKMDDRMALAQITLSFTFQERGAPLTTGKSRFKWLNRLDLPTLMERFDYGYRP